MSAAIDLTGHRYGQWTVIRLIPHTQRRSWLCQCDCGTKKPVQRDQLHSGRSKSCGCLKRGNEYAKTHGYSNTPTWRSWFTMRQRCRDRNNYAGRGITVDPRWESFSNFLADMGERPSEHSLERIDNDGPYTATNCRWATPIDQANNRRNTRFVTYEGKTQTLGQWARELGLSYNMLYQRISRGWPIERAFTLARKE
jgi:hypothetical protein